MLSVYRLPNKMPDEVIKTVIRKDLFILFKKIVLMLFLLIIPFALFYLIISIHENILEGDVSYPLIVLSASAYYLFVWVFFFFNFVDYYLDVWVITNKRIIDIEQKGFFSRVISEQKIINVQDVTSETLGIIPTLLRYGEVHVQTAGAKARFVFEEVPNPDSVRDMIIKLAGEEKEREKKDEIKLKAKFSSL